MKIREERIFGKKKRKKENGFKKVQKNDRKIKIKDG
jgi:hypothetical protein